MSTITIEKPKARTVEELLSSVSASRLSTWLQCRLKFWFRYISGLKKAKSPALHVGTSCHETLKYWNKARWRQESPSLKQLYDVYAESWESQEEPVNWDGAEADQKKTGWRLLETYFRESPIAFNERVDAVEVSVEAVLQNGLPSLVGIIDLVRHGGRIVDFKSSSTTPNPATVELTTEFQTTSYAYLYREATGKTESAIELHHLIKTKNPKLVVTVLPAATDQKMERLFRVIESYKYGLQAEDFVPSPGLQCVSCEFRADCIKWA